MSDTFILPIDSTMYLSHSYIGQDNHKTKKYRIRLQNNKIKLTDPYPKWHLLEDFVG